MLCNTSITEVRLNHVPKCDRYNYVFTLLVAVVALLVLVDDVLFVPLVAVVDGIHCTSHMHAL
jgi:hypothetical protein